MAKKSTTKTTESVTITAPRMRTAEFTITGTAPLMVAKFSSKARDKIEASQRAGQASKTKKKREARNFEADFEAARHRSPEGWDGVAAAAFRNASIDACRAAGYQMTKAKLAIFCEADGYDAEDGTPLVRIICGEPPEQSVMAVRNQTGVMDLRARPMWRQWAMVVRLRFDEDLLSLSDVTNLMHRVGLQVGIGEGRPFGKSGNGMGFGLFTLEDQS